MYSTLDNMLNTLGSEGGRFIARQSEVSRPTLNTVGNITNTITRKVDGVNIILGLTEFSEFSNFKRF